MKKTLKGFLILVLVLGLMFAFAACKDNDGYTSPTDVDVPDVPEVPEVVGSVDDLINGVGLSVTMPEDYKINRYTVVNDNQAQIEFKVDEEQAIGRVAKGQQTNMSGVTDEFDNTETVDINGISATVRYPDEDDIVVYPGQAMGIIDAYDAANDISYSVTILGNATKDKLVAAMTALIDGTAAAEAVQTAAEESPAE